MVRSKIVRGNRPTYMKIRFKGSPEGQELTERNNQIGNLVCEKFQPFRSKAKSRTAQTGPSQMVPGIRGAMPVSNRCLPTGGTRQMNILFEPSPGGPRWNWPAGAPFIFNGMQEPRLYSDSSGGESIHNFNRVSYYG